MSPSAGVAHASSRTPTELDEDDHSPAAARTAGAELAHKRALARARRRTHGRARSARRLEHEPFTPPPGWQHRPALHGRDVVVDQAYALERVRDLLELERWRADRHESWSAMLAALVHHMDWATGLATITREALAAVGGVDVRTVTTMIRWARDVGLLAVVEAGATAAFLGADRNRAQTYALTVPTGTVLSPGGGGLRDDHHAAPDDVRTPSDLHGDAKIHPPTSHVKDLTLVERLNDQRKSRHQGDPSWPLWQVPETPAERTAAAASLAERLGVSRQVPAWRLRALLACWWRAGACIAGLLHAVDHHPDQPDQLRGDALRGAHDPIRVLGHRLRPWLGRLDELPTCRQGQRGDYRAAQAARLERLTEAAAARPAQPAPGASATRAAARAAIHTHLHHRGRQRGARPPR